MDSVKIMYAKNLVKFACNIPVSVAVDSNANIKTVLDINSYVYDEKMECGNGKAVISGKVGVKVLYIDTDNISNTITTSQSFSETYVDNSITSDSIMMWTEPNIINTIISQNMGLKLNLNLNFCPTMYINLALPRVTNFENMIVKKRAINTSTILGHINTPTQYVTTIETKDNIVKILGYDCSFVKNKVYSSDEHAVVEGRLFSTLIYETNVNGIIEKREIKDNFHVKMDVAVPMLAADNSIDLVCLLDRSREIINTDIDEDNTVISIEHHFVARGVVIKNVSLDIVEDMYSTDNELDLHSTTREYNTDITHEHVTESISGEITLDNDEPAIDDIVSLHNIHTEITNRYVKNDTLYLEGIITGQLLYLDENKEYISKESELPFIVNTKIGLDHLDCINIEANVLDCRAKAKRGTIVEVEYMLSIDLCLYTRQSSEMIDNLTIGKELNFSMYDYQIFIAKPDETMWDLAKRIKISPDKLAEFNPNLPLIMQGNEKIIIKR